MSHSHPDRFLVRPAAIRHVGLLAAISGLLVAVPGQAVAEDALDRIQARGSVIIGHRETSVPLSYIADGKPVGYAVEICQKLAAAIAHHLGAKNMKTEYKAVTSSNRFDAVEKGEIDMECGSTTNTAARRQRVAFTIPHFIASSRLMVLSSRSYEMLEDLNKTTVASTSGTTNIKALEKAAQLKSVDIKIELAKDHAEAVSWVLDGKVTAFAMDDVLLYGLRATSPKPGDLKIIGKSMTVEPYAIGFQKDNPILKKVIDNEMRRMIAAKEVQQLYDKWFLQPIPPKGINLGMKMPALFASSLRYPTDYVPD